MLSFPNAKINIGLNVVEKRDDGYHNIETVFYPVGLCDALEFVESASYSFEISGMEIPGYGAENIVEKAYRLFKSDFGLPDISIHLHKKIPSGAGLGGGSSDGAFMLKMLNEYFQLKLSTRELITYASKLGADCPFFIGNKPVFATGTGDRMQLLEMDLTGYQIIIIKPSFSISTAVAYDLVNPQKPENHLPDLLKKEKEVWKDLITNDFEQVLAIRYPEIEKIKSVIYENGAIYASLSGSGSAVYGIFRNLPVYLEKSFPEEYFIYR